MTSMEKLRKRTRKNWKREQRAKYRFLMSCVKMCIKNAPNTYCVLKSCYENDDYFALCLVSKKLEAKGFKCKLKFIFSGIFHYELTIMWG